MPVGTSKAAAPLQFPTPLHAGQCSPLPLTQTHPFQMERCSEGYSTGTLLTGTRRPAMTDDSFALAPSKRQRTLDVAALATTSHGQWASGVESPDSLAYGRAYPPFRIFEGILLAEQRGNWSQAGPPPACKRNTVEVSRLEDTVLLPSMTCQLSHEQALGVSDAPAGVHQQLRAALVDSAAQRLKSAFLEEQLAVAQDSLVQARAGLQAAEDQATLLRHYLEQCLKKLRENGHAEGGGEHDVGSGENSDDAESCCKGNPKDEEKVADGLCRRCRSNNSNVLLIPCRHLAVCKACEPHVTACPLCKESHAAALHIQEA